MLFRSIDSTFYGVMLNNAPIESVTPWFHGQVIDMLYFPIYDFYWPEWVPYLGGEYFLFFSPVFNIADSSIFIGVITILFSQKKFFKEHLEEGAPTLTTNTISQNEEVIVTYSENGIEEQTFTKDLTELEDTIEEKKDDENNERPKEGNSTPSL